MEELEVIKQIKEGNQQAYRDLYDLYFDYAIRTATVVMNHQHSHAADAVQETFIRVYRNIQRYESDRPFKSWFYTILLNECNRILKRNTTVVSISEMSEQHHNLQTESEDHRFGEYEYL